MKIMKASAGSGKTYNLSKTYIDCLLDSNDRYAYRHILAVTFTNKATAEMKSRILNDLYKMSADNPKALDLLVNILHDYSAFSVSTIDKFFQQTLKSFSREIGQFADYQIELDKNSLIQESMDRILDSLTEDDHGLIEWIKTCVSASLERGEKLNIDNSLYEIGALLKSEEHRELEVRYGTDDLGKERLDLVRQECNSIIDAFLKRAEAYGLAVSRSEKLKMPGKRKLAESPELEEFFDRPYMVYCTAFIIEKVLFSLGLAGEFYKSFDDLLKEKNIMCLDESNYILKNIINGSDAPFVYEKMGVRYRNFLLDEFQDTSGIQWDNFLPLLKESESGGGANLVVGDIKQSIYRFRNSDWRLLGERVTEEFPKADIQTLLGNWRSTSRIVAFNNSFFSCIAKNLALNDIYSDVVQKPMNQDEQEGCVKVSFTEEQTGAVFKSIASALESGALLSDIAVLVRSRKIGAELALLIMQKGYPVISDDSLRLKASVSVRRLVSLLSGFDNPDDAINRYLASSMDIKFPSAFHSLVDLCESLLRDLKVYDPVSFEGETLYIQAFMDNLQAWSDINGNDLRIFLKYWEEADLYIGSPENSDAIRILTVHKSKGLEFPYLIFPFADKVDFYRHDIHWCRFDSASTPFSEISSGLYPIDLTADSAKTYFAEAYEEERKLQLVDNINIFYVALTRATKVLHIISDVPSKKCRESIKKAKREYGNFSEMLFEFVGGNDEYVSGSEYNFRNMERKINSEVLDFPASYHSIPLGGRLKPSLDAMDFFAQDGSVGSEASARLKGIVLHDILSRVITLSDLENAVAYSVSQGAITSSDAQEALTLLRERIAAHPCWFPQASETVMVENEKTIFDQNGIENRPDRVLISAEGVVIIDFKFGQEEEEKYLAQVRRYARLYEQLGYKVLSGSVWYVVNDECKYI